MTDIDVTALSWSQLNTALLECEDVASLQSWLAATVAAGHATRSMRVYGRMSAVRRYLELKDLRSKVKVQKRGKPRKEAA